MQALQSDKHPSRVVPCIASRKGYNRLKRLVLHDDVYELRHLFLHCLKRNILRGLYRSHNPARVLLRKEALGNVYVEINAQSCRENRDQQSKWLMPQYPTQAPAIHAEHVVECSLAGAVDPTVLFFSQRTQKFRAHCWRSRKGH